MVAEISVMLGVLFIYSTCKDKNSGNHDMICLTWRSEVLARGHSNMADETQFMLFL